MAKKKECVAMLLAGGQGSRLYLLTRQQAKPAVPFGSKYRIIDFPLSNCINSGIDTVGVLTQYQPLALNDYIGNGQAWDMDRVFGGVTLLPPYQGMQKADWYKGTANAIYQNINFIKRYDPEYVVVLSGDHIYKMNYGDMVNFHKKNNADCTIAVIDVPIEEASRFGIMTTDDNMAITKFQEKPKKPESTKASMGVYVFSADKLYKYLEEDENNPESDNDFGKNIIPTMLAAGEKLFAYRFEGYWKDVGTINSLWESNMDLLGDKPALDLHDRNSRIFSKTAPRSPQYIASNGKQINSMVAGDSEIYGTIINSVISPGVIVESGAVVTDSVIMSDVIIASGAKVDYSVVDSDCIISANATIGEPKENGKEITLVGSGVNIPNGAIIPAGAYVDNDYIDANIKS
ncbi:MAG: glucose-1-phosphate adenylyltransferase [Ruminococcaceae bacterium]|nr:glucose-1-phosphate adenylyltransferase [Oscillospiraceae bacterium]